MRITSIRIRNFRSIMDSGWVPLSPDGITVFVGQNESGKTSILDALHFALSNETPSEDDFRIGSALPTVNVRVEIDFSELKDELKEKKEPEIKAVQEYLASTKNLVELLITWVRAMEDSKKIFAHQVSIASEKLESLLSDASSALTESDSDNSASTTTLQVNPAAIIITDAADDNDELTADGLAEIIWGEIPLAVLFNEESGRLPNQVDINDKNQPTGPGAKAALNFLQIADINLPDVLKGDKRARENTLNKANVKVSEDFNSFWSQSIGKSGKLSLKCDIDNYDDRVPEKAGKPHLVFWISDGNTQLYPKQRSQGVRWFVSFYLQLKASEKSKNRRIFLLDEPGANLHSKAQGDVLKLINKLGKETSTVIYSTHSPQMLEYSKLFRVHAVQRDGEQDDSPSVVIDAHQLGTASTDTLSPVLTAMGVDLSNHQVIRKDNNVLLEEMSGYYYMTAFWKLTSTKHEAHFIAATGVNKIEALANMFRGWGLDFIIAVDDDKQGREAFKSIKRELFGDDENIASKKLLKLPDCTGIEDAFSTEDFKKYVLRDGQAIVNGTNTEFLKQAGRSKPVLAFQFALAVESGEVTLAGLDKITKSKIKAIVEGISTRLTNN